MMKGMRGLRRICQRWLSREVRIEELTELQPQRQVINLPDHLVEEKRTEDGQLIHHRLMSDDQYMQAMGVNLPSSERRSAYYSVVRENRRYHVFNADRKPYGEIITRAAVLLTGKLKPTFTRNKLSVGDVVVIVNADKILMRGDKLKHHKVRYHTGSPGGLKTRFTKDLIYQKPESVFIQGVYGVLPKTQMRETYLRDLHVNTGPLPRGFPWLPGFTPTPHIDRNALVDLPLDSSKHKIVHATNNELPPELVGFEQESMSPEEIFGQDTSRKLPGHIQKQLQRYNAWVKRTRGQMKDWRARPPRTDRNQPFKDSFLYYYHSDKQMEKYPFLRDFFQDNKEIGEEGEKD